MSQRFIEEADIRPRVNFKEHFLSRYRKWQYNKIAISWDVKCAKKGAAATRRLLCLSRLLLAAAMIVAGFIEPVVKELPMEYAVELNRLIELEMEGSVG